jgi:predicted GTPase
MSATSLATEFQAYSQWRGDLINRVEAYRQWLNREDLNDSQRDMRLHQLLNRLAEDKLHVAFIAEFSRGKSELINAIFLSDLKQRLLPSSAGRTTMCPTELLYDAGKPARIELLPIETRATNATVSEYKNYPEEWTFIGMDVGDAESVVRAMQEVCRVKAVDIDEAKRYGLYDSEDPEFAHALNNDGTVSIPAWRHAIINYPHPLLEKGLVVYDTPGLNAIGVEPELTFNLLPNAHAILFVLSADAGVTKTDIDVWRGHIHHRGTQRGRLVALNKIDGLWDDIKSPEAIEREIDAQVQQCANLLGIPAKQVFPVSAQKGLLAKIQGDEALLARSRLADLEKALSDELIASKQGIVRDQTESELADLLVSSQQLLGSRRHGIDEQLLDLKGLRGKNQDVVEHIMGKIAHDKQSFEKGLQQFQALRSVFSQQSVKLFALIGMDQLKASIGQARDAMENSRFSKGMRDAMNALFARVTDNMRQAAEQVEEINKMMAAMYKKLSAEHGLSHYAIPTFSLLRYQKELSRLEQAYQQQINTVYTLLTTEQHALTARFFETVASRIVHVYNITNREAEGWLKAIMSPMESQVREHQIQLRRRLESVKRIHKATDTLEDRIGELEQMLADTDRQARELRDLSGAIRASLDLAPTDTPEAAAAA